MSRVINILLVEDDQVDATDIKRSLDKLNVFYKLTHVKNGEEALFALEREAREPGGSLPDIMLVDINMPRMNGLELIQAVRNDDRWKNIKCFIITTSDDLQDKATAKSLNVSGYIVKPFKINHPSSMDSFNLMIDLLNMKQ